VPVLLGDGERLLAGVNPGLKLEPAGVVVGPRATHLTYQRAE
jgi:hypothetical protein